MNASLNPNPMCLTKHSESVVKKATEDIVVYKHADVNISGMIYSPYRHIKVSNAKQFPKHLKITKSERILSGIVNNWMSNDFIYRGFHSFKTLKDCMFDAKDQGSNIIIKCIIPKGSHCCNGCFECVSRKTGKDVKLSSYVSTEIIYSEVVKAL